MGDVSMTLEYKDIQYRKGRFCISVEFIQSRPDLVQTILGNCIVFKSQHLLMYNVVEYFALSELFGELQEGQMAPQYRFVFNMKYDDDENNILDGFTVEKVYDQQIISTEKIQWV